MQRFVFTAVAVLACYLSASSQVLLSDDFNDNSLDKTKWTVVTAGVPYGPWWAEQSQRMELSGRAHLNTHQHFDPGKLNGIEVSGTWTFVKHGDWDRWDVITRSNGIPTPPYGETQHGLRFSWWTRGQLLIGTQSSAIKIRPVDPVDFMPVIGKAYRFTVRDSGDRVSLTVTDPASSLSKTISATVVSDSTTAKLVTFHNRENLSGRTLVHLDDVLISKQQCGSRASANPFGTGCASGSLKPTLRLIGLPRLGNSFQIQLKGFAPRPSYGQLVFGWSKTRWDLLPLPLDLTFMGAPSCKLYVSIDLLKPIVLDSGGQFTSVPVGVPSQHVLCGLELYMQGWAVDLNANGAGIAMSDGLALRLGS